MSKMLYIIGGCNGAGKTTASYTVLPDMFNCREFVNADEIAHGLSPFNPEGMTIEAGRLMLKRIKERGGFMIFNHTAFTRKQCELLPHTMSFVESRGPVLASNRHLSHPTNLGYYPGYKYLEDEWKSPNGMFLNAMENLDWGCLTYVYWPQSPLQEKNFVRHFFPITVRNIYAGCVEGEEKIITNRSGFYTFHDAMRPKVLIYDANGVERTPKPEEAVCSMKNGLAIVELHLPTGGAAVLFRGEGIEKALEDELN